MIKHNLYKEGRLNAPLSNHVFKTEDYEIKKWEFSQTMNLVKDWNDCFCFIIVANGEYDFSVYNTKYHTYTGHVLIEKPKFEYALFPTIGKCTVFNFTNEFYNKLCDEPIIQKNEFFSNPNIISQLLLSNATIDYLHYKIASKKTVLSRLEMDDIIFELLYEILSSFTSISITDLEKQEYQKNQLKVIERAKEYIQYNFSEDIGLQQIAENSFSSAFHFSRLFRKFTLQSPHQYLLNTRLKHGEILLKTSLLPIADVSTLSGFSNPDYFATAFKKKYRIMPTLYRKNEYSRRVY